MCFDVFLGLVLHMTDLFDLFLQLVNHSICVSLRIVFLGAYRVRNIIIIMSYVPYSVLRTQLVSLIRSRTQRLNFLRDLNETDGTFYASFVMALLEGYLKTE